MHATVRTPGPDPTPGAPLLRRVLADTSGRPVLEVCLWGDEQGADEPSADASTWTVFARYAGRAGGEQPVAAQLVRFDGPRDAAAVAASRRAGGERIWPAVRELDGLVDVLVLERPDGAELVVSSATSVEHFARAGERIMTVPLLPGEDPALLPGPDRVEVLQVLPTDAVVPA